MFGIEFMGFRVEVPMTWTQLRYLLSGPKRCPECAAALERMTKTRDDGFGWEDNADGVEHTHTTRVGIEYECRRCRKWYTLSELAARARR
jgi:hypothetical protein